MKNSTRATLFLLCVLVVVGSLGAYWAFLVQVRRLDEAKLSVEHVRKQISETSEKVVAIQENNQRWDELQGERDVPKKCIPAAENSQISYEYFHSLLVSSPLLLEYDFVTLDQGQEGELHYTGYEISGEGTFTSLFNFMSQLETLPRLYRIDQFEVVESRIRDPLNQVEWPGVSFSMRVRGYSNPVNGTEVSPVQVAEGDYRDLFDPFAPRFIARENNDQMIEVDVDVDFLSILSVAWDTAFLKTGNGKVVAVQAGTSIRDGFVTELDTRTQSCSFVINRNGLLHRITLTAAAGSPVAGGRVCG